MLPTHNTIPYEARPVVTYGVMVLCVAAFGHQLTLSDAAELRFLLENALVPARYTDGAFAAKEGLARGDLLPFVTSMFLHGGLLHIAGNLWTLWVFGPALEDRLGTMRYAGLYIGAGLAAGLAHFVFNWTSTVPALGASGAIAGVIGAYVRRFPYAWINVLQPIGLFPFFFYMPALVFAGIWFWMQVMQGIGSVMMPGGAGGVAWWAHIGGFLVGWFMALRIAPDANPVEEQRSMRETAIWPWREMGRWAKWWWGRKK